MSTGRKTTAMSKTDDVEKRAEPMQNAEEGKVTKPKKSSPNLLLWLLVAAVVATLIWFLFLRGGGGESTKVGDAQLDNIQTYLSRSGSDADKKPQSAFKKGDPIQVGFTYENVTVEEETLVKFVVKHEQSGEEAFATNFFMLDPEATELFVSINNTNLAPGQYTVELQDADGAFNASVEYDITE